MNVIDLPARQNALAASEYSRLAKSFSPIAYDSSELFNLFNSSIDNANTLSLPIWNTKHKKI